MVGFDQAVRDASDPSKIAAGYLTNGVPNTGYHDKLAQTLANAITTFPPSARNIVPQLAGNLTDAREVHTHNGVDPHRARKTLRSNVQADPPARPILQESPAPLGKAQ